MRRICEPRRLETWAAGWVGRLQAPSEERGCCWWVGCRWCGMSIYGDAEGGGESLSDAAAGKPTARPAVQLNMTEEQKKKAAVGGGAVLVIILLLWMMAPDKPTCSEEEAAAAAAQRMPVTVDADGTVHFQADGKLQKREHDAVTLPLDYQVKFTITPGPTVVSDWSSIVHFSATGNNCCDYGDRVPGVWFYPGKRQLHIIDGHGKVGSGNDECVIEDELVAGRPYNVQIDAHEHFVEVYVNDVMQCTEPRQDRRPFPTAKVYASDPWYAPADAVLAGLQLKPLAPVPGCTDKGACDYDVSASVDNHRCTRANGSPLPPAPSRPGFCGPPGPPGSFISTELIAEVHLISPPGKRIERHAALVHEDRAQNGGLQGGGAYAGGGYQTQALHAIVPLPIDYEVEFDIIPDAQKQDTWASIVHFTATMSNCCEYGDRLPGAHAPIAAHFLLVAAGVTRCAAAVYLTGRSLRLLRCQASGFTQVRTSSTFATGWTATGTRAATRWRN